MGFTAAAIVEKQIAHPQQPLERLSLLAPLQVIGSRNRSLLSAGRLLPYQDQAARVTIWQRMEHHRFKHAEHRGVSADAERQRQDSGYTKTGLPRKRTNSVAKFVHLWKILTHFQANWGLFLFFFLAGLGGLGGGDDFIGL